MPVDVTVDFGAIKSQIADLVDRQVPYVASLALNATVKQVVDAERATMLQVFDRPVDWTLNSMMIAPSNKAQGDTIVAEVRWKEFAGKGVPAWKYLDPEIEGGPRRRKSHELRLLSAGIMKGNEYAVPGAGVTLDANGNMPPQLITSILSQVKAAFDPYARQTVRSKRRLVTHGGAIYFVRRQPGAPPGIYQRMPGRRIVPVIMFVRVPLYSERFDAFGRARTVVDANLYLNFQKAWQQALPSFRKG